MRLVNLTPHAIHLMPAGPGGPTVTIPPSGTAARCATQRVQVDTITVDGVQVSVNRTQFGAVDGLPGPQPDTLYLVSVIVAQAVAGTRTDVVMVDDAVRDEEGRIIGARALARP